MKIAIGTEKTGICVLCNFKFEDSSDAKQAQYRMSQHLKVIHDRIMVSLAERPKGRWELHGPRWQNDLGR